ncbi:MAG TPA: hypothetical protein VL068_07140 [Microthrixaceae bacterium]|nr:hypothetical protein [Microthrixaceae bacterium]
MTDVLDSGAAATVVTADGAIRDALDLIDQGLGDISERTIVSSSEMSDLLLDVRCVLARLDPKVSTN